MKAADHVILFHSRPRRLIPYLPEGLVGSGEAVAFVAGHGAVEEVDRAVREFGPEVDRLKTQEPCA